MSIKPLLLVLAVSFVFTGHVLAQKDTSPHLDNVFEFQVSKSREAGLLRFELRSEGRALLGSVLLGYNVKDPEGRDFAYIRVQYTGEPDLRFRQFFYFTDSSGTWQIQTREDSERRLEPFPEQNDGLREKLLGLFKLAALSAGKLSQQDLRSVADIVSTVSRRRAKELVFFVDGLKSVGLNKEGDQVFVKQVKHVNPRRTHDYISELAGRYIVLKLLVCDSCGRKRQATFYLALEGHDTLQFDNYFEERGMWFKSMRGSEPEDARFYLGTLYDTMDRDDFAEYKATPIGKQVLDRLIKQVLESIYNTK